MPTFTYRITSTIPWADVVEEPDNADAISAGQTLVASGNHTVSAPIDIDAYNREWTLTFPDMAAWEEYKAAVLQIGTYDVVKPGFSAFVVSSPDNP